MFSRIARTISFPASGVKPVSDPAALQELERRQREALAAMGTKSLLYKPVSKQRRFP